MKLSPGSTEAVLGNVLSAIKELATEQRNFNKTFLDVSNNIITGSQAIVTELQTHTKILNSILKELGGKKVQTDKALESSAAGSPLDMIKNITKHKKEITETALLITLLGGAFLALGYGIGMVAIDPMRLMMFTLTITSVFNAIATIMNAKSLGIKKIMAFGLAAYTLAFVLARFSKMVSQELQLLTQAELMNITILTFSITAAFRLINDADNIGFARIFAFNLTSVMFATSIRDVSIILSEVNEIDKKTMLTILGITYTVVPAFAIMAQSYSKISIIGSIFMSGTIALLPALASSVVLVASIMSSIPSNFNFRNIAVVVGTAIAMYPLVMAVSNVYKAITVSGMDRLFGAVAGGNMNLAKGASTFSMGKGGVITTFADVLKRLGTALLMMPMIGIVAVLTAHIMRMAPSRFLAPPIAWVLSIGLGMMLFASAMSLAYIKVGMSTSIEAKATEALTGKEKWMNRAGKYGTMLSLAGVMVGVAVIMQLFPKAKLIVPDLKWVITVGLAMMFFAKSFKSVMGAMKGGFGTSADSTMTKTLKLSTTTTTTGSSGLSAGALVKGMAMMMMIPFAIVTTAYIFQLLPDKFKSPPLDWTLQAGLAMWIFSKPLSLITKSTRSLGDKVLRHSKGVSASKAFKLLSVLALSIVTTAMIFQFLPENYKSPPLDWTLQAGIAMWIFSKPLKLMSDTKKTLGGFGDKAKSFTSSGLTNIGKGGGLIMILAGSIVVTAWLFKLLPNDFKAPPLGWTIQSGLAMMMFSFSLTRIYRTADKTFAVKSADPKDLLMTMGLMLLLATSIVATAFIFAALPGKYKAPPIWWTIQSAAAMFFFSFGMTRIIKSASSFGSHTDIGKSLLMIGLIAVSIVSLAWVFQLLPPENKMQAPGIIWTISVALAVSLFAVALWAVKRFEIKYKDMLHTTAMFGIVAVSIVAVANVFRLLPSSAELSKLYPPADWTIYTALALVMFGGAFALLGIVWKSIMKGALAMSVAMIPLGVIAFTLTYWKKMKIDWKDLAVIGVSLLALGGIMLLISCIDKNIEKGSIALLAATIPIAALAIGLTIWSEAKITPLDILTIAAAIAGLGFAMATFGKMWTDILKGSLAMTVAVVPVILLAITLRWWVMAVGTGKPADDLLIQVGIAVTGLGVVMALAGATSGVIAIGALQMILAGLALIPIAFGIKYWKDNISLDDNKSLYQIAATLGGMIVTFTAAGLGFPLITLGAIALAISGLSIIVVGYGLNEWFTASAKIPKGGTIEMLATLGGIGLTMSAMGALSPAIILGSAAMVVAGFAIGKIGEGLNLLAQVKADSEWLNTSKQDKDQSNLEHLFDVIGSSFMISPFKSAGILLNAPLFLLASHSLLSMAAMFKEFNTMDLDFDKLLNKDTGVIPLLLNTITDSFATVGDKNAREGGFTKKLIGGIFTRGKIADGIQSVRAAGDTLSNIAAGVSAFANLTFADYSSGKKVITNLTKDQLTKTIPEAITSVLSVVGTAFAEVGVKGGSSWFDTNLVEAGVDSLRHAGNTLADIAAGVMAFANLTYTKYDKNGKKIGTFSIPADWLTEESGQIPLAIKSVLKATGDAFADVGRSGESGTEWYQPNYVKAGVKSLSKAGESLSSIAAGVMAFASLTFTKYDDKGKEIGKFEIDPSWLDYAQGKIPLAIRKVLKVVSEEFAAVGKAGEEGTAWFETNYVTKGIEKIKGAGAELGNIAKAVQDFASMTYTKYDDKGKEIGKFSLDGDVLKNVKSNIRDLIGSISETFAQIGSGKIATGVFDADKVEDGVDIIKNVVTNIGGLAKFISGIAEVKDVGTFGSNLSSALISIGDSMKTFYGTIGEDATIYDSDLEFLLSASKTIKKVFANIGDLGENKTIPNAVANIQSILFMLPDTLLKAWNLVRTEYEGVDKLSLLLERFPEKMSMAITTIADRKSDIEQVAISFTSIAKSMGSFQKELGSLDVLKMEKMNTIFTSIKEIAYPKDDQQKQDIPGQIANGIETGLKKGLEYVDQIYTKQADIQTKAMTDASKTTDGTNAMMMKLMQDMMTQMNLMNISLTKINAQLGGEMAVKVTNESVFKPG